MSESNNSGHFLAGFLAGAVIGAIATILYTPTSGEENRAILKEKKDSFVDKANLTVDDAYKQAEVAAREARDKFDTLASTMQEKAAEASQRGQIILEQRMQELKKKAEAIEEEAEEILMPEMPESTPEEEKPEEEIPEA